MQKNWKAIVIGVGNMGKNHARAYFEIPNVKLVAIADINPKIGQPIAQTTGAKYYSDYLQAIKTERPDLVSICVPTAFHYQVARVCIQNNIHTLLEKPIAMNIQEASNILRLAKSRKIKLLVGHIERFNPAVQKVKSIIEQGELGKIITIMARRVGGFPPQIKDADIAVDLAIHDIDIVNYLMDEQPRQIYVHKQKNHIKKREDSVEFFLQYRSSSAHIQANWITPVKIRKLNITGTEGYLEMDYINQKIEFYKSNYEKFHETTKNFSDYILKFSEPDRIDITIAKREPLKEEIMYFLHCLQKNIIPESRFALEALKIALK